jgi:glycosyltransferase involved in cell wall biosynthesis
MSKIGGVDVLIDAIRNFKNENVVFEFFGKGKYQPLIKLAEEDSRVSLKGFVTEEELELAMYNADALLSPRDLLSNQFIMIFPSKLLYYLEFGKPIISTPLPGVSYEYDNLLFHVKDNNPNSWVEKMIFVQKLDMREKERLKTVIETFLETRTWEAQAKRLISFVSKIDHKFEDIRTA